MQKYQLETLGQMTASEKSTAKLLRAKRKSLKYDSPYVERNYVSEDIVFRGQ